MGKITVQLEDINRKVLADEGRLKRYRQRVKQYRQNRTFQNNEILSTTGIYSKQHLKEYQTGKRQSMIEYMASGSRNFTSIHGRLALEMNRCLHGAKLPEWMTKRKNILIQNNPSKGTAPNNYRPITCQTMMWKILTAQIRENIYYALTSRGLFPNEHEGCRKESRSTAELLYIDQHILNQSKTKRKNLAMAWID